RPTVSEAAAVRTIQRRTMDGIRRHTCSSNLCTSRTTCSTYCPLLVTEATSARHEAVEQLPRGGRPRSPPRRVVENDQIATERVPHHRARLGTHQRPAEVVPGAVSVGAA